MNLPIIPIIKSVTDLRYQTASIVELVKRGEPVVVTKGNDTVAVLFSPKQYQQILDLFAEFEDKEDAFELEKTINKGGVNLKGYRILRETILKLIKFKEIRNLDLKLLEGRYAQMWRLRVGSRRISFTIEEQNKIIKIWDISERGNLY